MSEPRYLLGVTVPLAACGHERREHPSRDHIQMRLGRAPCEAAHLRARGA